MWKDEDGNFVSTQSIKFAEPVVLKSISDGSDEMLRVIGIVSGGVPVSARDTDVLLQSVRRNGESDTFFRPLTSLDDREIQILRDATRGLAKVNIESLTRGDSQTMNEGRKAASSLKI